MDPKERLKDETEETVSYLKNAGLAQADVGVVLGFGLAKASQALPMASAVPIESIPNFPVVLSYGYGQRLLFSPVSDKTVVLLEGHFNLFEGYTARSVAYPIWIMGQLGVKALVFITAGLALKRQGLGLGDLVVVKDFLNFIDENPLVGMEGSNGLADLFSFSSGLSAELSRLAGDLLDEKNILWHSGVAAFRRGPLTETLAEANFLKKAGADLVCYSGYPEIATATLLGMKVVFLVVINGLAGKISTSQERLKIMNSKTPIILDWLKRFLRKVEVNGV